MGVTDLLSMVGAGFKPAPTDANLQIGIGIGIESGSGLFDTDTDSDTDTDPGTMPCSGRGAPSADRFAVQGAKI
jgi:hypothetical protein